LLRARELRLERRSLIRIREIAIIEDEPVAGERQANVRIRQRELRPAGRSSWRRRRGRRRWTGATGDAAGKENRPGEDRQGGCESRCALNRQALTTTVPAMRSNQPRRRLSTKIQM
jgi:hypothetical protein